MEQESSTSSIRFDAERKIIFVTARAGAYFDVQQALENKAVALQLTANGRFTLLFISNGDIVTTPEMRRLCASPEYNNHLNAVALLSPSSAMKILGNFYLRLNRPAVPTRFFTVQEMAVDWLVTFAEQEVQVNKY